MKIRGDLTLLVFVVCGVATGLVALLFCFSRCERVEWVEVRHISKPWSAFEAWCVPVEEYRTRVRFRNRLKIRKANEEPVVLKFGSDVHLDGYYATRDFLYGFVRISRDPEEWDDIPVFVFRADARGKVEVCTEIKGSICFDDDIEFGKDNEVEWAALQVVVPCNGEAPRRGRLEMQLDQCVDGSDLVSLSGRIRSWLQRFGLGAPAVHEFSGSVPTLTVQDIVFAGEPSTSKPSEPLSSAKTTSEY